MELPCIVLFPKQIAYGHRSRHTGGLHLQHIPRAAHHPAQGPHHEPRGRTAAQHLLGHLGLRTSGRGLRIPFPHTSPSYHGANGHVIMPRVLKSRDTQTARSRDMAEVFTPSWICNAQNNLIDEAWFGRKEVFNVEQKIFLQLQSNYVLLRMKIKEQIIVILTIKLLLVFSPFCASLIIQHSVLLAL